MKVAILMPTMNRLDLFERTIGYYDSLNSPHPIYIGDASDSATAIQASNILKRFKNLEVKHFHWEGLDTLRTIVKLAEHANKENQYCAFTGNDDYFIPSSLTASAQFLSENKTYRTVQGRAAIFTIDSPGAYGKINSLGQYWGVNCLEQETGLERLKFFSKNYFVPQFSTHRTDEFIEDSELYREISDYSLSELLHCFTFAIKGKSKFLDCLYLVRGQHIDRVNTSPIFIKWVMKPVWSSECNKIIDGLSHILSETDGLPLSQSKKIVADEFRYLFELQGIKNFATYNKQSLSSRIKQHLPNGLRSVLRKLKTFTMDAKDMRLLRSKKSSFYKEFLPVMKSLDGAPKETI